MSSLQGNMVRGGGREIIQVTIQKCYKRFRLTEAYEIFLPKCTMYYSSWWTRLIIGETLTQRYLTLILRFYFLYLKKKNLKTFYFQSFSSNIQTAKASDDAVSSCCQSLFQTVTGRQEVSENKPTQVYMAGSLFRWCYLWPTYDKTKEIHESLVHFCSYWETLSHFPPIVVCIDTWEMLSWI